MNDKMELVEVQGTAEKGGFTRQQLNAMLDYAEKGISKVMHLQKKALTEKL